MHNVEKTLDVRNDGDPHAYGHVFHGKKETFESNTMENMIGILVEINITTYGEAKFDSWGAFLQPGVITFEATRLVLIQILLTSKGNALKTITTLDYVSSR